MPGCFSTFAMKRARELGLRLRASFASANTRSFSASGPSLATKRMFPGVLFSPVGQLEIGDHFAQLFLAHHNTMFVVHIAPRIAITLSGSSVVISCAMRLE